MTTLEQIPRGESGIFTTLNPKFWTVRISKKKWEREIEDVGEDLIKRP